jgi:cytochrome c-type biogenesis protein CcmH
MHTRREFLSALGACAATALVAPPRAWTQGGAAPSPAPGQDVPGVRTTMSGPMNDNAYRLVQRAPKPGAIAVLTADQRDALEHHLHCQCGCTLDVYTCRTTDFTCPVSPAMHQDVMRLVQGGYDGLEIMAAFRSVYGERVLMAPVREGFNWAAYGAPFVALGAGAAAVAVLIRRWQHTPARIAAESQTTSVGPPDMQATPEELARIDAAIRDPA